MFTLAYCIQLHQKILSLFCCHNAPSYASLIVVAATIQLVVSRIRAVVARDTSTTTTSMNTVTRLTGTATPHCNVVATAHKITVVARNTRKTTMDGWVVRTRWQD